MKKLLGLVIASIVIISFSNQSSAQSKKTDKAAYGKNLITFSPIGITDRGVAVGLTYERRLDDDGILHFSLPVFYTFNDFDGDFGGNYGNTPPMYIAAYPGIKIYPTGSFGIVRYAVGPSLAIVYGQTHEDYYYYNYPINGPSTRIIMDHDRFMLGMMVNNSLNVNFSPKFYLGTELGLGVTYINNTDGYRDGTNGLVRMSFSFGYRF